MLPALHMSFKLLGFEIYVNYILQFSKHLTENTVRLHYKDRPIMPFGKIIANDCENLRNKYYTFGKMKPYCTLKNAALFLTLHYFSCPQHLV